MTRDKPNYDEWKKKDVEKQTEQQETKTQQTKYIIDFIVIGRKIHIMRSDCQFLCKAPFVYVVILA